MIAAPTGECADGRTPWLHETSFLVGPGRVYPEKAMSNLYSDPGYWMDCFNGIHKYLMGVCTECGRRDKNGEGDSGRDRLHSRD